jgi:quercetin dioxygenase-like cupin family protein
MNYITMEKETIKANPLLSKSTGSLNSLFFTFDLPTLIENMKLSHSWEKGDLNAMVLLKSPEKQIVLTALHEGTEISSFQANDSITFQIIEGELKFQTRKESVTLSKGQLLTLHENIKYRLKSTEETVFLLTILNGIVQPVENKTTETMRAKRSTEVMYV